MAPQQRKNVSGKTKDKEKDDKKEAGPKKAPTFLEKHVLKIQLSLMFVACLVSVVPRMLQGHDRYRFEDSYKDPIAWHRHFAKEYSSLFSEWEYQLHTNASVRLHSLLGRADDSISVLDVGAGSGLVGMELKRLGIKHITGVDVVSEILEQANETGAYERAIAADAEHLPMELPSASFDAVMCIGTVGYLGRGERDENGPALDHSREAKGPPAEASRVEKLLQEWLRVLKPGGILGITAEVLLKSPWEDALHKLREEGHLTHLEASGPLLFVPKNMDKWISEQKVHMYFNQKPE
jgi:ubiquinone/menaquinone biosynthesis C-methylase UbiE